MGPGISIRAAHLIHKGADKARHPSYTELLNALSGAMEPKPQSGHRALWGFFVGNSAQDGGKLRIGKENRPAREHRAAFRRHWPGCYAMVSWNVADATFPTESVAVMVIG